MAKDDSGKGKRGNWRRKRGWKLSAKTRAKMSSSRTGKVPSDATRAKMSESQRARRKREREERKKNGKNGT